MVIKLESLNSGVVDEILLDEDINFGKEYLSETDIIDLKNTHIKGRIYINSTNELILEANIEGIMVLEDSISLEDVEYKFSSNIEEIFENNQNSIDIIPILWQNIVLEVPLRFTTVKDYSKYSGNGWKLIDEKKELSNNPFIELSKNYKEE